MLKSAFLLRQAVNKGDTALVAELIQAANSLTLKEMLTAGGEQAFEIAAEAGRIELVELLLEAADKARVLDAMIRHAFKTLISRRSIPDDPNFKAIVSEILFQAGKRDDSASIKLYFELSSSIGKTRYQNILSAAMTKIEAYQNQILPLQSVREFYVALTKAVEKSNVERVNQLFVDDARGASQYLLRFNHSALLRTAVKKGNQTMVETLLAHASDETKVDMLRVRGCEFLGRVVEGGRVDMAVSLLKNATQIGLLNEVVGYQNYAIFRAAVKKGRSNSKAQKIAVEFLFQAGKKPESQALYRRLLGQVNTLKDKLLSRDKRRSYYSGLIRESRLKIETEQMISVNSERASCNGFFNSTRQEEIKQNDEPTLRHSAPF